MPMIKELLSTDVGLLSLFCFIFMLAMSAYMFFWIRKHVNDDAKQHQNSSRPANKQRQH